MKKASIFILLSFFNYVIFAQSLTIEQYIETYKDIAISEMKRMGVPAAITLAQGILETENGNSDLVKRSNNHFGIKCKSTWSGNSVFHDDDAEGECFRKYSNAKESFRDHSNFLRGNERYSFLFKLDPADYKKWAWGLKKAGYATNPRYPDILIKHIEQYNLQQYSLQAVNQVPVFDSEKYTDDKSQDQTIVSAAPNISAYALEAAPVPGTEKTLFNGLKAVYAAKETSLLAIAMKNDIALSRLLEFNDLQTDGLLKEDSWIFLEKKLKEGHTDYYTALKDESLYDIAQINAIQLSYLLKYNHFNLDDTIKQGLKVLLRPMQPSVIVDDLSSNAHLHEVQPKEGLYAISKKYNVSVIDLKEWNKLDSDDLRVGQKLIISK